MAQSSGTGGQALGWLLAIGVGVLAIARCSGPTATPDPVSTPSAASVSTPGFIAARALRCRSAPAATASSKETLIRAMAVTIVARDGGWSQLDRPGGDCWVATAFLTDTAPNGGGGAVANSGNGENGQRGITAGNRHPTRLAAGIVAAGAGKAYGVHRTRTHRARSKSRRARASHTARRGSGYSYGGNCPCAGRTICIGPRGGRYCITSGGNKRYGV